MAAITQLEGNITINAVDYADDVTSLVVTGTRAIDTSPGTFADSDTVEVPGSRSWTVTINFNYDEGDATGLWAELWAAFLTDTGELPFTATPKDAVTSATNPLFSGTIIVTDIDAMGTVGDRKTQSKTFPAKNITMAIA